MMELSVILKRLIKAKSISVSSIAKKTGVPAQTIHNWLAGVEPKNLYQVKKIADFFDVSLDYLCFGTEINKDIVPIEAYRDEINAGIFEVVLRRVKKF